MVRTAFVFPGQGSQEVGMGLELAEKYSVVAETFQKADEVLGFPLSKLCFEGPMEELTRTENTQPALVTAGVAVFRLLKEEGITPDACAGHSLGEYAALTAAGAMKFEDAIRTVRLRGRLMEEAVPSGKGGMAAVLGLDAAQVETVCGEVDGVVEPAAYNSPGQVVVAGEIDALKRFCERAKEASARRAQMLNVSGPFHSSLLEDAGKKLAEWLEDIDIKPPQVPVYANVTGKKVTTPEEIRKNLAAQVSTPVLWEQSVREMTADGFETFIECGPGKVLSGLIRRIHRKATIYSVGTFESFEAVRRDKEALS